MINHTHTAMMLELLLKWLTAKVRAVSHAHTHTDIHKNLDTAPELLSKRSTAQLKEASYTHNAGHNGGAAVKVVDSAAEGGKLHTHTSGHNAGAAVKVVNSVAEGGKLHTPGHNAGAAVKVVNSVAWGGKLQTYTWTQCWSCC